MADEEDLDENEDLDLNDGLDDDDDESGGKSKLPLIIGGVILLLVAVGAGLFFTGMLDGVLGKSAESGEHADGEEHEGGKDKHAEKGGGGHGGEEGYGGGAELFVPIPSMIVNLSGEDGVTRYLRLSVQLELEDASDKGAVEAVIPRVIDQFQTYLRELRVKDLRGSAGIYRLQMELLWRVNQAAAPVKIKDILFQEILIQ